MNKETIERLKELAEQWKNRKPRDLCPECEPACPYCRHPRKFPSPYPRCVLNDPLMMVIPPEGVHLSCPRHPEGHHVFGSRVTCSQQSSGSTTRTQLWADPHIAEQEIP